MPRQKLNGVSLGIKDHQSTYIYIIYISKCRLKKKQASIIELYRTNIIIKTSSQNTEMSAGEDGDLRSRQGQRDAFAASAPYHHGGQLMK
jgi:hypothetical protein